MAWKIALAGIGKIARDQHVPSISPSADFELAATVTRHEGVDDIENYTDIDAMLEARPDIEVVSLCLPPVPRFEYAAAAIKADLSGILSHGWKAFVPVAASTLTAFALALSLAWVL